MIFISDNIVLSIFQFFLGLQDFKKESMFQIILNFEFEYATLAGCLPIASMHGGDRRLVTVVTVLGVRSLSTQLKKDKMSINSADAQIDRTTRSQ